MTTPMPTDLIKLGHLFAEIASGHDVSRFEEIVAPDYVNHNAFAEPGLEGVKKVFGGILAGVPDLKVLVEEFSYRRTAPAWSVATATRVRTTETSSATPRRAMPSPCARSTSGGSRTDASSSIGTSSTPSTSSSRSAPCRRRNNRHDRATPNGPQNEDQAVPVVKLIAVGLPIALGAVMIGAGGVNFAGPAGP